MAKQIGLNEIEIENILLQYEVEDENLRQAIVAVIIRNNEKIAGQIGSVATSTISDGMKRLGINPNNL